MLMGEKKMGWRCTFTALIVVAFMLSHGSVADKTTTNIVCLKPGINGKRADLKCTVTGEPKGGITWIRPDGKRVLNCAFPMSTCKILVARYGARKFEPSVYYLTIQSFNVELDVGKWTCKEGSGHVESSCEKTSEDLAVTHIDCMDRGFKTKETRLTCKVSGNSEAGILFKRPDGRTVVTCGREKCLNVFAEYVSTFKDNEYQLTIRSFDKKRDGGTWTCQVINSDVKSSCEKLVGRHTYVPTNIECLQPAVVGETANLTCEILRDSTDRILWKRPDGNLVTWCNYKYESCTPMSDFTHLYQGSVISKTVSVLLIKKFNPKNDEGLWVCQQGFKGQYSTCFKKTYSMDLKKDSAPETMHDNTNDDASTSEPEQSGFYKQIGLMVMGSALLLVFFILGVFHYSIRRRSPKQDTQGIAAQTGTYQCNVENKFGVINPGFRAEAL